MNRIITRFPVLAMSFGIIMMSFNAILAKVAFRDMDVILYVGILYFFIGLGFFIISRRQFKELSKVPIRALTIAISLQALSAIFGYVGLSMTLAVNASLIGLLAPIMVYVGSIVLLHEPRSMKALSGSLIAMLGGVLMFGLPVIDGVDGKQMLGNGLIILAIFFSSMMVLILKTIITDKNINVVLGSRNFGTGLLALIIAAAIGELPNLGHIGVSALSALAISVIFGGVLGALIFYKAFQNMRAEDSASLIYLDPLVGSIGATILLGEVIPNTTLIAAGVIIAGVIVAHPVHINRMFYFQKIKHSNFDDFLKWATREQRSIQKVVKKYF